MNTNITIIHNSIQHTTLIIATEPNRTIVSSTAVTLEQALGIIIGVLTLAYHEGIAKEEYIKSLSQDEISK